MSFQLDFLQCKWEPFCACPWCNRRTESGCFSIMGQPTCKEHSGESVIQAIAKSVVQPSKTNKE